MNQRKLGSIITYAQMILTMIVSLIYTPYMIQRLGESEYGLYNTVASTISMLAILNLGFASGYIRYYSVYRRRDDNEAISRLNGLFLIIFMVIGLVGLLCGLFLSFHLEYVFETGLTPEEYALARVLMIILTVNLAVSFPMSVFSHIISAHERFVLLKLVGLMKTVCGPLVTIPLLLMGFRSVAIAAVTVSFAFAADAIYVYYVLKVLKQKFVFHGFEKGLMRDLSVYTVFIAINLIVDQINWNIDKLVLARFRGTAAVAVYSVGYTLMNYYNMVSTAVSHVFTPMVHGIVNRFRDELDTQRAQLTQIFTRVGRVQMLILGLFGSGLVLFGRQFIRVWAGKGYGEAYYVVLLLALPTTVPLVQNVGIEIQRALNKHRFRSIAYLIMALVNFGISVWFCQLWGPVGCAIGTAISMLLANGLIMNIYYHRQCNIDIVSFWKNILRQLPGILLPAAAAGVLFHFVPVQASFHALIPAILGYTLVYCASVWFLSMNGFEKDLIRKIAGKGGKIAKKLLKRGK